jgi:hypothetical protein
MTKKIKSFTVDEDAYNSLVKLFKDAGTDVSVSMFVNNCLQQLSELLNKANKKLKGSKAYTVPLPFIIKSIVESEDILGAGKDWPDDLPEKLEFMLGDWQNDYDAQKKKVPVEFYPFIKSGLYLLSPNKKYLIEKKTGNKYVSLGKNKLVPIDNDK